MSVLGIGGCDSFGNDAKLIVERGQEGASFRILIFGEKGVEYDISMRIDDEDVKKLVKFLMG